MSSATTSRLLDLLDELKSQFGSSPIRLERTMKRLRRLALADAQSLLRYHEILLFLRAYPQSATILRLAERELSSLSKRVERANESGADLSLLEHPESSGIAGLDVTDTFSYYIVRWLAQRYPAQIDFYWEWFEDENRLAESWPRFLPLLEEDAAVEANVPYRSWLREAKGPKARDVPWLIERFKALPLTEDSQAELYDSQKLYVRWLPSFRVTRTGMRLPRGTVFYHRGPLIRRNEVSLAAELNAPALPLEKLSPAAGEKILDLARATSTVRYRELYGFTHGDPARVLKADIGRGVDVFIAGLPPGRRLPLRSYHAVMIFKNGVPVGYFEGLSFFERMESGFNFYYTFREGETAWIYVKTLALFRHLLGVTVFSIDPYQIGFENEEGIQSGAFWFYRKLGFRPTKSRLLKLTLSEEKKIATRKNYRTPARILRELAQGPMMFELPGRPAGDWDRFQIRTLGLMVQRRMARDFGGDASRMRERSVKVVSEILGLKAGSGSEPERRALADLSLVLALIPDLQHWTANAKRKLGGIITAKAGADEAVYLNRLQAHKQLRAALIKLGS